MYTHIVTYTGNGKWQDNKLQAWSRIPQPKSGIKDARAYSDKLTHEEFLTSRPDLAFMEKYNHMTIMTVDQSSEVVVNSADSDQINENSVPPIEPITDAQETAPEPPPIEDAEQEETDVEQTSDDTPMISI